MGEGGGGGGEERGATKENHLILLLFVGCLTSQQHEKQCLHIQPAASRICIVVVVGYEVKRNKTKHAVLLFVGCITTPQHACRSERQTCPNKCTCCHTEIQDTDRTFYPSQSQYTYTRPTSLNADLYDGMVVTAVPILKSLVWSSSSSPQPTSIF